MHFAQKLILFLLFCLPRCHACEASKIEKSFNTYWQIMGNISKTPEHLTKDEIAEARNVLIASFGCIGHSTNKVYYYLRDPFLLAEKHAAVPTKELLYFLENIKRDADGIIELEPVFMCGCESMPKNLKTTFGLDDFSKAEKLLDADGEKQHSPSREILRKLFAEQKVLIQQKNLASEKALQEKRSKNVASKLLGLS